MYEVMKKERGQLVCSRNWKIAKVAGAGREVGRGRSRVQQVHGHRL